MNFLRKIYLREDIKIMEKNIPYDSPALLNFKPLPKIYILTNSIAATSLCLHRTLAQLP